METVHKIILSGAQFKQLVKGEPLKIWAGPVGDREVFELSVLHLGFGVMKNFLEEAEREANAARPDSSSPLPEGS